MDIRYLDIGALPHTKSRRDSFQESGVERCLYYENNWTSHPSGRLTYKTFCRIDMSKGLQSNIIYISNLVQSIQSHHHLQPPWYLHHLHW